MMIPSPLFAPAIRTFSDSIQLEILSVDTNAEIYYALLGREGSMAWGKYTKPLKARYVKVFAKSIGRVPEWHISVGEKAWLFIDEVIIQ